MKTPRQSARRSLFMAAVEKMPFWETWKTTTQVDTGFRHANGDRKLATVVRENFKSIPRKVRRAMARANARRTWQARTA